MNSIEDWFLPLPLTEVARQKAQQFAQQQPTIEKAEQVRLNTLAVLVVNDYLQLMGIPTNLTAGDSWNPIVRLCADVADLEIIGVGRLECRPLLALSPACPIPPEVRSDRIGYVVVQLSESLREATLVGFIPREMVTTEELPLAQLQAPEALLTHLHQLKQSVAAPQSVTNQTTVVNLSQWFEGVFETGWQAIEALLSPEEPSMAFSLRSAEPSEATDRETLEVRIRRAKLIDLEMQLGDGSLALLVEVRPPINKSTSICVQVHPTGEQRYLPPALQLMVLDESGAIFLSAQSRTTDNYIQLQFRGEPGEKFSIKVALGDVSITEDFLL
ncbi:MAG: DUF1822 family protein [Prochloraceae cyanobacterium]